MSRIGSNIQQFLAFGIVGGSGVIVNLAVVYIVRKLARAFWQISEHDAVANLFGSPFHIRWYHVVMTIAFFVANTWNYQLNRLWTFKSDAMVSWIRGFFPFLATGIMAFIVSQIVATLLMNPESPLALSSEIFDDSTGFRTKFYWASIAAIVVSMPVNFILNKVWTFRRTSASK